MTTIKLALVVLVGAALLWLCNRALEAWDRDDSRYKSMDAARRERRLRRQIAEEIQRGDHLE